MRFSNAHSGSYFSATQSWPSFNLRILLSPAQTLLLPFQRPPPLARALHTDKLTIGEREIGFMTHKVLGYFKLEIRFLK